MTYYVYGHYTADTNKLFYIGKGNGKRAWDASDRNKYWQHTVAKHGYTVTILHDNLPEHEALAKEIELIAEVGLTNLTNILPGGEGFTSDVARQNWQDPVIRQKILDGLKRAFNDPALKQQRSIAAKARMANPSARQNLSKKMKGNTNGIGCTTSEGRMRMKVTRTTQWNDPVYREKNLSARKRRMETGGKGPNANRIRNPHTGEYYLPNVSFPYTMQAPDGTIHTFTSIREFSKIHNIPRQQLVRVLTGKRIDYMGWVRTT